MTDALKVAIEGDSGKLISALQQSSQATLQFAQKAEGSVAKLNQRFTNLRNLVVGVFSLRAVRGLVNWVSETAKAQDETGKFADRIGFSVEELSRLQYAAELSGVSVDALRQGFQRATRRLAEFATTGKGEAATAIKELGLEQAVEQGQTFEELLPKISAAFASLGDQGQRVRLAQKLFDSEGVSLLQLLQQGPEAIRAIGAEADRLGVTLSRADTDRAAALVDAGTRLERSVSGLANAVLRLTGSSVAKTLDDIAGGIQALAAGPPKPFLDPLIARKVEVDRALRANLERDFALLNAEDAPDGRYRTRFGLSTVTRAQAQADITREMVRLQEELADVERELEERRIRNLGLNDVGPKIDPDELVRRQLAPDLKIIRDLFGGGQAASSEGGDFPDAPGFADGIRSGAQRVGELANAFRLADDAVYSFGTSVSSSLGQTFTDVITGAQSGSAAIAAFGRSVVQTFVEVSARAAAFKLVGSLFGAASAPSDEFVPFDEGTTGIVDPALLPSPLFKSGGNATAGTGTTVVINVQATGTSPADIVRAVQSVLPELAQAVEYQNSRSSNVKRPAA